VKKNREKEGFKRGFRSHFPSAQTSRARNGFARGFTRGARYPRARFKKKLKREKYISKGSFKVTSLTLPKL